MCVRSSLTISAFVAAVLFSIGYLLVAVVPGGGEVSQADFDDCHGGEPSFFNTFVQVLAVIAGTLALVWFFGELRARAGEDARLRTAHDAAIVGPASLSIGANLLFAHRR